MAGLNLNKYQQFTSGKPADKKSAGWSIIALLNKDLSLRKNIFSDKIKEGLYSELSILISAGIDIKAALELLYKQQPNKKVKETLNTIKDKVVNGLSLSEAVKSTGYFTAYEFYSLQIGEETGRITEILGELATYFAKKIKQRRQLIQALSYPVIVLTTSIGAVAFMLTFIVPMFSDVFKRFGGELPYITKVIIYVAAILRNNSLVFFILIGSIILALRFLKKKIWFQRYSSSLLLRLPIVGQIISRVYLARLCSSFGLLTSSKVPLLQAIILVKQMIPFYPIYTSLSLVEQDILAGNSLHQSLSKFRIYDPRLIALLKVGEEVNKLDFFFYKLASQYNDEVEYRASVLSSAMEPIIIIFLGAVVGIILVAMYLPLFQLSTNIG